MGVVDFEMFGWFGGRVGIGCLMGIETQPPQAQPP